MKQKRDKNKFKEPVLEKEVSTPNGKYSCEVIKDENRVFTRYASDVNKPKGVLSCRVKHNGKLEKFLGLNSTEMELTYLSFEGTEDSRGDYNINSEVKDINYNSTNNQFVVTFHHTIKYSDGISLSLSKRIIQIPVPKTISRRITDFMNHYLKKVF